MSRFEDPQHGVVGKRSEACGMTECRIDIVGRVALAQRQNAASVVAPLSRGSNTELTNELSGVVSHLLESSAELVGLDRGATDSVSMEALWVESLAESSGDQLVHGDAHQVSAIHEQLSLGDADGQDVGDVVVWDGVAIALPIDVAIDVTQAVGDPGGVVRMAGQRHQMRGFVREAFQAGGAVTLSHVDHRDEPVGELRIEVVEVAEIAPHEERALVGVDFHAI